ncbi:MAG TPA: MlaD family protein [Terriglobales bacterium]|nr:MlaD family protein [Terriglobales bacterium]
MNGSPDDFKGGEDLPQARVKRRRWSFSIVWIVPVVAAIVAGYLVYSRFSKFGPDITVRFRDASGIRAGQTFVKYRGVPIGEVKAVELSDDHQYARVIVRLHRSGAAMAKEGSLFWIVRPEVGVSRITGLGTVVTGPEINVLPGGGKSQSEFVGLPSAPVANERHGLHLIIRSNRLGALKRNSPIYYRGLQVGAVQDARLSRDATAVEIEAYVNKRYANLVRTSSKFWNVSGVGISGGLLRGVQVRLESLRSLAAGGIAFATPDTKAKPAKDGAVFLLYNEPLKEWLEWTPKIAVPQEE